MGLPRVTVVGGGLAGCECALTLAARGIPVELHEMRPETMSPAHHTGHLAELVCSNSLKATRIDSAAGLLKAELERMGSALLSCAREAAVPAGGALAVDRERFSAAVEARIASEPLIEVVRDEVTSLPLAPAVIAAGPLCAPALAEDIRQRVGGSSLAFFDAAAPIVDASTVDRDVLFAQSRYEDQGAGDYLNAPFNREEYERFIDELVAADRVVQKDFERGDLFQACQPVEEIARTGRDALRFGALKPVGLTDPRTGHRPWAVLQLRKENADGSMYNLVGFQTNLKFGEQKRVFSLIPALANAEFVRYGVMHRNTFIHSPSLLEKTYALCKKPNLFFAGQITGVEGYMESAMSGILAGRNAVRLLKGQPPFVLPPVTMCGALTDYITDRSLKDFQPMGASFGLLPPLDEKIRDKKMRYEALAKRALAVLDEIIGQE